MIEKIKNKLSEIEFAEQASEIAASLGVEIYIVGGFVRDILLNRKNKDIDFVVIGDGPKFAREFAKELNVEKVTIFKNFGTAHFKFKGLDFEFVGARIESYNKNSRNPEVLPGTFEDDIKRRDFTINSIAISLNSVNFGKVVDLFDGVEDIGKKIIRTPLDPIETFSDDPLRIMRAFRFASELNFKIEESLLQAAELMASRLEIISQERITSEFLKILASPQPSIGLKYLFHSKVLKVIFPEIFNLAGVDQIKDFHHKDVFFHTCQVVDNISNNTDNLWLRFAALVHDIAKPKTKKFVEETGWTFHGHEESGARMMKYIFRKLKLPNAHLHYVENLVRLHLRPIALANEEVTDSAIRRLIVSAGEDLDDLITLCRADITSKNPAKVKKYLNNYERVMRKVIDVREKDELRAFQSPVRGDEIMKICNLRPSKTVGEIKTAIETAILDGKIGNTYADAYEYLLKIKDDFCSPSNL